MHSAIAVLSELSCELRKLLTGLGGEADGAWQVSWARCQELFVRFRAEQPDLDVMSADEREHFTTALDEVMRLNAVAAGLVTRETEKITESLRAITSSKRRVREQSDAVDTVRMGGSCDIQG